MDPKSSKNSSDPKDYPLPGSDPKNHGAEAAGDLIRERIQKIHEEKQRQAQKTQPASLIEQFWHHYGEHPDTQQAWQDYYHSLNVSDKHKIWEEYRQQDTPTVATTATIKPKSQHPFVGQSKPHPEPASEPKPSATLTDPQTQTAHHQVSKKVVGEIEDTTPPTDIAQIKQRLIKRAQKDPKLNKKGRFKPLVTATTIALIVLALNYNELAFAQVKQFISPGSSLASPIIIDPSADVQISKQPRIIIPKINVDVPVVYNVTSDREEDIQAALQRGVVHYANTPKPGQAGNNVIVGHSSNNFFNSGKYKFAFVLLDRLEKGDTFILHYRGQRYIYKVYRKVVVEPNDFSVVEPTNVPTTTLITCTPPGTSWRRLVIQAEQISPQPKSSQINVNLPTFDQEEAQIIPGNSPSLWNRFTDWIF